MYDSISLEDVPAVGNIENMTVDLLNAAIGEMDLDARGV
jgi:hypothetical protein